MEATNNLKLKKESAKKALETTKKAIYYQDKYKNDEELYRIIRSGQIQNFEVTIDILWKFIKEYIEVKEKTNLEVNSPKWVLKEAGKLKLIKEDDIAIFIEMIDSRNSTSHIYREEIAEQISYKIDTYIPKIEELLNRCIV